jgi:prepilin-type N-terminal cleavage/methylation domain-containing protein
MSTFMKEIKRVLDSRGETLIELMIAVVIIGMTLTVVITVFMSGRAGIESSWDLTEDNQCASYVMEQLKAVPYEKIQDYGIDHWILLDDDEWTTLTDTASPEKYSDYEIEFYLSEYKGYSKDQLVKVKVRVHEDGEPWMTKASLIRKGESS